MNEIRRRGRKGEPFHILYVEVHGLICEGTECFDNVDLISSLL